MRQLLIASAMLFSTSFLSAKESIATKIVRAPRAGVEFVGNGIKKIVRAPKKLYQYVVNRGKAVVPVVDSTEDKVDEQIGKKKDQADNAQNKIEKLIEEVRSEGRDANVVPSFHRRHMKKPTSSKHSRHVVSRKAQKAGKKIKHAAQKLRETKPVREAERVGKQVGEKVKKAGHTVAKKAKKVGHAVAKKAKAVKRKVKSKK